MFTLVVQNDHQTIDDILDSFDDNTGTNRDGEDADDDSEVTNIIETELPQSRLGSRTINDTLIVTPPRPSPVRAINVSLIVAPPRPSPTRAMSIFNDDLISSHGAASQSLKSVPSRSPPTLNSGAMNVFDNAFPPITYWIPPIMYLIILIQ